MDVDDPRNNRAALKVGGFGSGARQGKHIPVAAHGLYRLAADRQGLVGHAIGGHREHFAVVQHNVRDYLSRRHDKSLSIGEIKKTNVSSDRFLTELLRFLNFRL
jgi:hypothetical protein